MSSVATAIVASAVVGGVMSNKAAGKQADAAAAGTAAEMNMSADNIAFQREMAEEQRADFAPWRETGEKALQQIWEGVQSGAFQPGGFDVTQDPGYQFRMDEATKALDRSASSRGMVLSGAQNKAVNRYTQNLASQEYQNAYARDANEKSRKYNILSSLSGGGQASAAGQAQASGNLAQTAGNIMSNTGRSMNLGMQKEGAARAGAYGDQAQIFNQASQNWLTYKASQPA